MTEYGSGSAPILGLIWPDDGQGRPDYELLRLKQWLTARGYDSVAVVVERSVAGRSHTRADLLITGKHQALEPPARLLAAAGAGVIAWACTSGSFIGGLHWARAQAEALNHVTGLPVTSATLALIDAVRALGASRVDVIGAYPEDATSEFVKCLETAGIEVKDSWALDCWDGSASFQINLLDRMVEFVRRTGPCNIPILVPDTAINTLDYLDRLEEIAGRPVVTANQAIVWRSLGLLGLNPEAADAGALFRISGPVPASVDA